MEHAERAQERILEIHPLLRLPELRRAVFDTICLTVMRGCAVTAEDIKAVFTVVESGTDFQPADPRMSELAAPVQSWVKARPLLTEDLILEMYCLRRSLNAGLPRFAVEGLIMQLLENPDYVPEDRELQDLTDKIRELAASERRVLESRGNIDNVADRARAAFELGLYVYQQHIVPMGREAHSPHRHYVTADLVADWVEHLLVDKDFQLPQSGVPEGTRNLFAIIHKAIHGKNGLLDKQQSLSPKVASDFFESLSARTGPVEMKKWEKPIEEYLQDPW